MNLDQFTLWSQQFKTWLSGHGVHNDLAVIISNYSWIFVIAILAAIAYYVVRKILYNFLKRLVKKSKNKFDDILLEKKFFQRLSYFAPAIVFYKVTPLVISHLSGFVNLVERTTEIYMMFAGVLVIDALFDALHHMYLTTEMSKTRPIKGFIQVAKIILYSIVGIILISWLLGQKPLAIIGGLGALSAVIMLIFKDSILGFVAGIQLSVNNMVRIGDWVTMSKYEIDGVVTEISLTTVKIQNFDNTISTLPTYSMIADAVKNWRGMEEAGGRRISRALNLDMSSVKFCTSEMLERYEKFGYVSDYVKQTEVLIQQHNLQDNIDNDVLVNGRRQTNLGIFRAYLREYLKNNPDIHDDMTIMVRQLAPTEKGLPMQLYCFTKTTAWVEYEGVQSDIFDHILAIIPYFDLKVFQSPAGNDFKRLLT
ncbi:MAG TPA: mechanosensitive ion channel protein MscS [Bacteroidales bacterium]|nr:MAG: mechanosensitive ion channel protein MscS [Bacteroidetes bacterium GWE2_42_24]OFY31619.1 MAG: mechanosensitive ion channel protein MscS [Bacteroidetes bacterium GWF2_43_11]HAQ64427.1 mechanosensitive ion channel protein MscS [Bacteroidales bacterium]HBZ67123.1 mechanosensitive ion channel protein MscS [Bacteroidales bacterium]